MSTDNSWLSEKWFETYYVTVLMRPVSHSNEKVAVISAFCHTENYKIDWIVFELLNESQKKMLFGEHFEHINDLIDCTKKAIQKYPSGGFWSGEKLIFPIQGFEFGEKEPCLLKYRDVEHAKETIKLTESFWSQLTV